MSYPAFYKNKNIFKMKNRIFNTLILFVFGLSLIQAQVITAEFDETEIGVGATAVLTVTANPPNVDQEPGEFQILIDFPQSGNYIDSDGVEPVAGTGSPVMTWITIAESGGSDTSQRDAIPHSAPAALRAYPPRAADAPIECRVAQQRPATARALNEVRPRDLPLPF